MPTFPLLLYPSLRPVITVFLMLALTEKQLGQALFYAVKREDFDHAEYLLSLDAPVATSHFLTQDRIAYTPNLLASRAAATIKRLGVTHARSQQVLRILDAFIAKGCDWRCHCIAKNPHYCPISEVLRHIRFESSKDLLVEENLLLLKLIFHGATYRNLANSKDYVWIGIQELNAYITVKKEEAIELIKMNRHGKACLNRHAVCSQGSKVRPEKI